MKELIITRFQENHFPKKSLAWNEKCNNNKNTVDIFRVIESNKYEIRKRYLKWIYEIQNLKINSKKIINHLKMQNSFSFWWMQPISEKSNFLKSFQVNEIIKLIALEYYLKINKIKKVSTYGLDQKTNKVISFLARKNNLDFSKQREKYSFSYNSRIINFLKSFIWLFYFLLKRRFLIGENLQKWKKSKNQICIVNYLFDINQNLLSKNIFSSGYWNHLIDKIHSKNIGINWLHIYFENEQIYSSKKAKSVLNKLSKNNSKDIHVTLESFINFKILLSSLKVWFKIFIKSFLITETSILKNYKKNNFFIILSNEFAQNLQNHHSLKNVLIYFLIKRAFSEISKQESCIFINENQPWEMALISNYINNGHENIIGYQHATTRFWDLRNFNYEKNDIKYLNYASHPKPNILGVHSKIFYKTFLRSNYPRKKLKIVEAIKYRNLIKANYLKKTEFKIKSKKIIVTVILGGLQNFDKALVNCLKKNIEYFDKKFSFYFKEQSSSDKQLIIGESKNLNKINGNIIDVLKLSDLVIISNSSSSVLDAIYTNTPFFIYDGSDFLNFSPMYDKINKKYFIRDHNFVNKIKSFTKKPIKSYWKFDKKNIINDKLDIKAWEKIIKLNKHKKNF